MVRMSYLSLVWFIFFACEPSARLKRQRVLPSLYRPFDVGHDTGLLSGKTYNTPFRNVFILWCLKGFRPHPESPFSRSGAGVRLVHALEHVLECAPLRPPVISGPQINKQSKHVLITSCSVSLLRVMSSEFLSLNIHVIWHIYFCVAVYLQSRHKISVLKYHTLLEFE